MTQNRYVKIGIGVVIFGVIVVAAVFAYIYASGGSGVSDTPVTAPTLPADTVSGDVRTRFSIVPDESQVRFIINEELMGTPTEVIGETNQVAGEILVDFQTPANTEVGTVRIDLATVATPNEMRNRALRGQILQSTQDEFQYAEFAPTAITGLPDTVTIGTPFDIQITGNLTVHGATNEVTFAATITPISETRIEGSATTEVLYADYGMSIPNAPGVANVTPEVGLEIDFVATVATDATAEATQGG